MKRLLSSTTAISLALTSVQPWPLLAQTLTEAGTVVAADGTVLCEPSADLACDPADPALVAKAQEIDKRLADEAAAAQAEAAAQAQAEADAAAAAAAKAEAEATAAAQAEADAAAAAQAETDAAAAAQAQAEADAAAQAQAEADAAAAAQAQAEADAAAQAQAQAEADAAVKAQADADAAAAAQAQTEADAAAKAQADADAAAAAQAQAEADAAAQAQADADAAAAAQAEADAAAAAQAQADADAAAKAQADADAAAAQAQTETDAAAAAQAQTDADAAAAAALAAAEAELAVQPDGTLVDPAAGLKTADVVVDPNAVPVDAPVATETEVQTLTDLLTQPDSAEAAVIGAVETAAAAAALPAGEAPLDAAPPADAVSTQTETLTADSVRTSAQEFAAAPVEVSKGKKDRLSNLEKFGLVALGALAVGTIINQSNKANAAQTDTTQSTKSPQVVSNTGDRVVVLNPDGSYQVYKDDDAVIRQPGSTVRTETYKDGSTRTIIERTDGTQIVTIRDALGRVLRRAAYDANGNELVLIDDLRPEQPVVVSTLPKPAKRPVAISTKDQNAALKAALAANEVAKVGRTFSLRQIRDIPEVRWLAPTIDVTPVTFDSGSAAIQASQAQELADLGRFMQDLIDQNPGEMFLIEGHTDATGKAAMNLALSDRRAESVALALTEYFDIPPENMVVQGYGETELLIDTQADEKRNRRVEVRIITPLLNGAR